MLQAQLLLHHMIQLDGSFYGNAANPHSLAKLERYIIACTIDIKAQNAWLIGELDACKPKGFFDGSQGQLALFFYKKIVGARWVVYIHDNYTVVFLHSTFHSQYLYSRRRDRRCVMFRQYNIFCTFRHIFCVECHACQNHIRHNRNNNRVSVYIDNFDVSLGACKVL